MSHRPGVATRSRKPLTLLVVALCAATMTVLLPGAGFGEARERSGISVEAAAKRLGVTYGPYLGKRCRDAGYATCELIGLDIVFRRPATRVVAAIAGQRINLRTPGKHNGIRRHDWVGNFTHSGLARGGRSANRGGDLLYVPVELRVRFADGRHVRGLFPRVLVSPGWG